MDKKTLLICDFAEMLVIPTENIKAQTTKICALQAIALKYGWLVIDDMENSLPYLKNKKTMAWMHSEIQDQMNVPYPQQPETMLAVVNGYIANRRL